MEKNVITTMEKNVIIRILTLSVPGLILTFVIVNTMQNSAVIFAVLAILIIALLALAALFSVRFVKQEESRISADMLSDFIDSVPMGVEIFDKDCNCLEVNKATEIIFNTTRQEYLNNPAKFFPKLQPDGKDSKQFLKDTNREAVEKGSKSYEFMYQLDDGTLFPVMEFSQRIMINGVAYVACYTQDMRDAYKLKEIEREHQERVQSILDASPLVCAIFDKDSNCIEVNKAVETMFNATRDEYMNNFDQFLPPFQPNGKNSMQHSIDCIAQAFEKGFASYEFLYQLKDGTPLPVEEISRRITIGGQNHIVCYIRDLREYKELEKTELLAKKMQVLAEKLHECVQRQTSALSQSSTSIEEMIANIRSVTETLSKNAKNVKELEEASEVGRSGLGGVAADTQEIARESESLLEINSVMANIASQTNLLSMNAAIEAAHAGENGRGFAVVADEIRKLAESSGNQSKTISGVLKKIKGSIDKITRSTEDLLNKFEAMNSGIITVAEQENSILRAMEEQGQGSKEVLEAISEVNKITHQVRDASEQMLEGGKSA